MKALRLAPLQVAEYHPEPVDGGWAIYRDCTPVLNVPEEAQPIASGREWLNWGCRNAVL
jgi:hypothetical protein